MKTRNKKTITRADKIEIAVAALIDAREFDLAAWTAEKLPARRQRKALKAICAAI